jgi:hypothetical protein
MHPRLIALTTPPSKAGQRRPGRRPGKARPRVRSPDGMSPAACVAEMVRRQGGDPFHASEGILRPASGRCYELKTAVGRRPIAIYQERPRPQSELCSKSARRKIGSGWQGALRWKGGISELGHGGCNTCSWRWYFCSLARCFRERIRGSGGSRGRRTTRPRTRIAPNNHPASATKGTDPLGPSVRALARARRNAIVSSSGRGRSPIDPRRPTWPRSIGEHR